MNSIAISRAYKPVEIDLWGSKFETVDLPRSASKRAVEVSEEVTAMREDLGHADWDELVAKIGEGLDIRLQAVAGGKKKASSLLKAKWKADEISLNRIFEFLAEVATAELLGDVDDQEGSARPS